MQIVLSAFVACASAIVATPYGLAAPAAYGAYGAGYHAPIGAAYHAPIAAPVYGGYAGAYHAPIAGKTRNMIQKKWF